MIPTISAAAVNSALAPLLYSAVTCLSMPSLFASNEIPLLLRHVNHCLVSGGALHLTIIDPQPEMETMGPKLRQWLFDNLVLNLEEQFRTTYPSQTFPSWLAGAGLRGKGSSIAHVKCPAAVKEIAY